jgi:hypothetical protein
MRSPAHDTFTTIATGIENVAPWHPDDDAELIDTAPARSTSVVPDAASGVLRPVVFANETPVVTHAPVPPEEVIAPFPATLTSVTAK